MTLSAKTKEEYVEKRAEEDAKEFSQREQIRAVLDRIEAANLSNILTPYMGTAWVRKQLSRIRTHLSHPHVDRAGIPELYTELCAQSVSCAFIIDYLTVTPATHQIAQQYAKLLEDRLTFIERWHR